MNKIQLLTLVMQGIISLVFYFLPSALAAKDNIQIEANGSLDSLKEDWHFMNVVIRLFAMIPPVLLSVLPAVVLRGEVLFSIGVAATLLVLANAWHWKAFDRELNRLRNLAPNYVGGSNFFDRVAKEEPNAKNILLFLSGGFYLVFVFALISGLQ